MELRHLDLDLSLISFQIYWTLAHRMRGVVVRRQRAVADLSGGTVQNRD